MQMLPLQRMIILTMNAIENMSNDRGNLKTTALSIAVFTHANTQEVKHVQPMLACAETLTLRPDFLYTGDLGKILHRPSIFSSEIVEGAYENIYLGEFIDW